MPKRNSKARPTDVNELAHMLVERSTEEKQPEKPPPITRSAVPRAVSRVMAKMGAKGGRIGGKRRLVTMSDERRREIAAQAAKARWDKARQAAGING